MILIINFLDIIFIYRLKKTVSQTIINSLEIRFQEKFEDLL